MSERVLGKEHADTLTTLNNLAGLYHYEGRLGEAGSMFMRTLKISQRLLGREHTDTLTGLSNLAAVYDAQGRHADSERLLKEYSTPESMF